MYAKKELAHVAGIIRRIAQEHNIPESQVRADMQEAIEAGKANPDPGVQARWSEFPVMAEEPAIEEFILWITSQLGNREACAEELVSCEQI